MQDKQQVLAIQDEEATIKLCSLCLDRCCQVDDLNYAVITAISAV